RRCAEALQEDDREREADAGSENAARRRRELAGAGGSESLPPPVAGDSLAFPAFSRPRRQDDDRQGGGGNDLRGEWARQSKQEEGRRAAQRRSEQGLRALAMVKGGKKNAVSNGKRD